MGAWSERVRRGLAVAAVAAVHLGLGMGCATLPAGDVRYDYFHVPDPQDAWSPKIAGWQRRELADETEVLGTTPAVSEAPGESVDGPGTPAATEGELRSKYFDFRAEKRRAVARAFAEWIQAEARNHYRPDGPIDHWATLEETLRHNGDDCDGLELLVFQGLRDLGFGESEVYRAIVYRPSDGQHHMVTLWFEDPRDPWVIDPTGAMVTGMRRMSSIPDWVPLKVFSDRAEYTVRRVREPVPGAYASIDAR